MTKLNWNRRDVVVTIVGICLGLCAIGAILIGAVGYDEDNESFMFGANLALGVLGFAFVAYSGYVEGTWRVWEYRHAVGFLITGIAFTTIAFVSPWTTGPLFAIIAVFL